MFLREDSKYAIIRQIGKGGTSTVYLARHKALEVLRAVKQIPKNPITEECYFVERAILSRVNIKGLPVIYDVEEDEENWYIIEEYIQGESFRDVMRVEQNLCRLMEHMCTICDILTELHHITPEAVIYNDLKAENVLISQKGVYVVDFGNCQIVNRQSSGNLLASRSGVSPEQIAQKRLDIQTDVYGIGVLLQEIYQLHPEFFRNRKEEIEYIISGCMEKEPKERFATPEIVKNLLQQVFLQEESKSHNQGNVYVYGSRRYAGGTHFSVGFVKYLSDRRVNAVYKETDSEYGISKLLDRSGKNLKYVNEMYQYQNCRMLPDYGGFVKESIEKLKHADFVSVYDCGQNCDHTVGDNAICDSTACGRTIFDKTICERDTVIVVIADVKGYGNLDFGKFSGKEDKNQNNIVYIANFADEEGVRKLARQTGIRAIQMPYFPNPFCYGKEVCKFYEMVFEAVLGRNSGRK